MAKKLSTNKKGDILEKACKEVLIRIFPWVEGPPVKMRFARRDYFTLFDFIVLDDYNRMIGIQVSSRPIYDRDRKFKEEWKRFTGLKVFCTDPDKLAEQLAELTA